MRIKELTLLVKNIESQFDFYTKTLGFKSNHKDETSFSVAVGWTILRFQQSEEKQHYHYCFLIPSNQLNDAIQWFNSKVNLVPIEDEFTYFFESWNARSFYFFDGDENIAECIVRYDLGNESAAPFDTASLLCINEIGMPSNTIQLHNSQLENEMESLFWKGDLQRFATNGTQEGLFLLVNNAIKKTWFPTKTPTQTAPFHAIIANNEKVFDLNFSSSNLSIKQIEG